MTIDDRITERYKGEISTEEDQSIDKQRIHRMCQRV